MGRPKPRVEPRLPLVDAPRIKWRLHLVDVCDDIVQCIYDHVLLIQEPQKPSSESRKYSALGMKSLVRLSSVNKRFRLLAEPRIFRDINLNKLKVQDATKAMDNCSPGVIAYARLKSMEELTISIAHTYFNRLYQEYQLANGLNKFMNLRMLRIRTCGSFLLRHCPKIETLELLPCDCALQYEAARKKCRNRAFERAGRSKTISHLVISEELWCWDWKNVKSHVAHMPQLSLPWLPLDKHEFGFGKATLEGFTTIDHLALPPLSEFLGSRSTTPEYRAITENPQQFMEFQLASGEIIASILFGYWQPLETISFASRIDHDDKSVLQAHRDKEGRFVKVEWTKVDANLMQYVREHGHIDVAKWKKSPIGLEYQREIGRFD